MTLTKSLRKKLHHDKHHALLLITNYEKILGEVDRSTVDKYTLNEQKCKQPGSTQLSKVTIQVYKNFQVMLKAMQ